MPEPRGFMPKGDTSSGSLLRFDGLTGETTSLPAATDEAPRNAGANVMGNPGAMPLSPSGISLQLQQSRAEGIGYGGANALPAMTPWR